MNAEQRAAVEHLKERIASNPYASQIGLREEHLKQLNSLITELAKDKARLNYVLKIIEDKGTVGISSLPWTQVEIDGEETEDFVFDRPAIDTAMEQSK